MGSFIFNNHLLLEYWELNLTWDKEPVAIIDNIPAHCGTYPLVYLPSTLRGPHTLPLFCQRHLLLHRHIQPLGGHWWWNSRTCTLRLHYTGSICIMPRMYTTLCVNWGTQNLVQLFMVANQLLISACSMKLWQKKLEADWFICGAVPDLAFTSFSKSTPIRLPYVWWNSYV